MRRATESGWHVCVSCVVRPYEFASRGKSGRVGVEFSPS
jgi:hypothetical protein